VNINSARHRNETVNRDGERGCGLNTTDATLGNTFASRQILALPFEGRDAAES